MKLKKRWMKKDSYKRIPAIWYHLFKFQEQAKLVNDDGNHCSDYFLAKLSGKGKVEFFSDMVFHIFTRC
jgi:hypothetical protein